MANIQNALKNMLNMCNDNKHGYSQVRRWPSHGNDRDCSSAIITALKEAGFDTGNASYTGNLSVELCARGWSTLSPGVDKQPGDILLNYANHVAMYIGDGQLAEFSQSETGGIDGQEGDQTGKEGYVHAYYNYPWDCVLRYTGAQTTADGQQAVTDSPPLPEYRVKTGGKWLDWMRGLTCTGGSGDDYAGITGRPIDDVEIKGLGNNGWYQLTVSGGVTLEHNQSNTSGKTVMGITVYYDTPEPDKTGYWRAKYRVGVIGGEWLKWEYDNEDGGAGDDTSPIDRLQITLER